MTQQNYEKNGILIEPYQVRKNSMLTVQYDGLLPKSGASEIYMHVSADKDFTNAKDVIMNKVGTNKFEARIQTGLVDTINFCFKDGAGNWDNNSGSNYYISVT